MVGPVLAQELLLGSRRGRHLIFRRIYTGWLVVQLALFYWLYLIQANLPARWFFGGQVDPDAAPQFASSFVNMLIVQQLVLLLLATPAYAAGAITDEKTRGTLQYLLTADLTSQEIVLGKLLGRVAQVGSLALAGLPLLCFIGVFGGLDLLSLMVLVIVTVTPLFALGSASLLASVLSKQTRDAVLGVYLAGVIGYITLWATGTLYLFDPLHVVDAAWGASGDPRELVRRLLLSVAVWGGLGSLCLSVAVWRLRTAYLRQLEGQGRPKKVRWWHAQRPAVPDEPVRWKERHVEGVAPLAGLRRVPRWLGIAGIFTVTTLSSLAIVLSHANSSLSELGTLFARLQFADVLSKLGPADDAFLWQSVVAMLMATLMVGLRCSGAVTGERESQTWEALLLTPLPVKHLIRGKLWGIVGATFPYLLAYAVPAILLSLLGGWLATFWVALWLGVTWLAMGFVGAAGLWCSVRSRSSWRSLIGTAVIGYAGGFILYVVALPVAGIVFLVLLLTLTLVDLANQNQTSFGTIFRNSWGFYIAMTCLALIGGFIVLTGYFVADAQKYVADRERIRHWKEEFVSYEPRRRKLRPKRPKEEIPEVQAVVPEPDRE